jgi:hypothetical protein
MGGTVRQILNWPGSYETFRKVPTCIAYYQASPNDEAIVVAWGIEAKAMTLREGFYKCVHCVLSTDRAYPSSTGWSGSSFFSIRKSSAKVDSPLPPACPSFRTANNRSMSSPTS